MDQATVVFVGDVVFDSAVSLPRPEHRGDWVFHAALVRVQAAWKRQLPAYIVIETNFGVGSCGIPLPSGHRFLFAFDQGGHAGLDRRPISEESASDGWVFDLHMCEPRHVWPVSEPFREAGAGAIMPDWSAEYRGLAMAATPDKPEPHGQNGQLPTDPPEARLMTWLRSQLGPPLPAPPPVAIAAFADSAQWVAELWPYSPWPPKWKFYVASVAQAWADLTRGTYTNALQYGWLDQAVESALIWLQLANHPAQLPARCRGSLEEMPECPIDADSSDNWACTFTRQLGGDYVQGFAELAWAYIFAVESLANAPHIMGLPPTADPPAGATP